MASSNGNKVLHSILAGLAVLIIGNMVVTYIGNSMTREVIELKFELKDKDIKDAARVASDAFEIVKGHGTAINENTVRSKENRNHIRSMQDGVWSDYVKIMNKYRKINPQYNDEVYNCDTINLMTKTYEDR